jgi:hypothetical protein
LNELSGWLTGTANKEAAEKLLGADLSKMFVQLKISTADAEQKAAKFNELKDKIFAVQEIQDMQESKMFNPVIKADGNAVLIGMEVYAPDQESKLLKEVGEEGVTDLIAMLKQVDQHVCA